MDELARVLGPSLALLLALIGVWRTLDRRVSDLERDNATRAALREERQRRELSAGNDVLRQLVAQQTTLAGQMTEASALFRITPPPAKKADP